MSVGNQLWRLGSRLHPVPGLSPWSTSQIFANSLYKAVGCSIKNREGQVRLVGCGLAPNEPSGLGEEGPEHRAENTLQSMRQLRI